MVLLKAATNPAETLKQHGQPWITEDDLRLLASVQANTVRIPIGYCVFVQAVAVCQRRPKGRIGVNLGLLWRIRSAYHC